MTDQAADETFARLYQAHFTAMFRLAALLGADDPEDVAQEAFVRLHRAIGRLRDPDRALSYLRATVCNLSRSRLRHLRVVRRYAESQPTDRASTACDPALRDEQREVLVALATLPLRQREALVLRYWLDLSGADVAAAMGISVGAVKSHVFRGLAALKEILEVRA